MKTLDQLMPTPRLLEVDEVEIGAPADRVWQELRHGDLGQSRLTRGLFWLRALPGRLAGHSDEQSGIFVDDLKSTPDHPGFQLLHEDVGRQFIVGAIGQVWKPRIPFVHVGGPDAFARFDQEGFIRVAWAVRVLPEGEKISRVEVEVRVDATSEAAWRKFRRYWRLIGPGSHLIRRVLLSGLVQRLGAPEAAEQTGPMPGDELIPDATLHATHGITINATPDRIWPWLVQMGGRRAGYYSHDMLDHGAKRSAREIHGEWQELCVGQIIPAAPGGPDNDSFEVLRLEPPTTLILGGLYDPVEKKQLPFASPRGGQFWQSTWAFVLQPLDSGRTRLHVRTRGAFSSAARFQALWVRPVHNFMQTAQLKRLAARVEGRMPRDDAFDVLEGVGGAAVMAAAMATPFLRERRRHWGVSAEVAARDYPGDGLIPHPLWDWTHGVEIDAPAADVWPWIAQIGADRGGFYSYQWLENLAGCRLRNAETIHPQWELQLGDALSLHPKAEPMRVAEIERGRYFVAWAAPDEDARNAGRKWAGASWLLHLEPLGEGRCRLISRYRCVCSPDLASRVSFGPTFVEPIGFAMDRRMLLGVKSRAEQAARPEPAEAANATA